MQKLLVTLLCEDKLFGILLPEKVHGRYWIEDMDRELGDSGRKILSIEGEEDGWKVFARRNLKLYSSAAGDSEVPALELKVGEMYKIELPKSRMAYLLVESYTEDRCAFKKYFVESNITLNIGGSPDNQIVIDSPYVERIHAQLSLAGDTWTIRDNNSSNGVYVNQRRLQQSMVLKPGDVLDILGVKIVLGYHFLAVNNPGNIVRMKGNVLKPYQPEPLQAYEAPEELEEKLYYRSPRFSRHFEPMVLKVDAPSMAEKDDDTPLALSLAPSLVMGGASFASGIVGMAAAVRNGGNFVSAIPTFVMAIAMLAGMVVFPFIMRTRDRKKKREKEAQRREKYLKYLSNVRAEIYRNSRIQQEILNENYPAVLTQMRGESFFDMVLWSRVIGREDFLTLRIGIGNVPLQAKLDFPDRRFSIDDDVMREEVYRFSEEKQVISGVPVVYSLVEHRASGIVGTGNTVNGILHNLLLQIALLHSYDEVKIVFLCDESNLEKYDYVRWMPHLWDNDFRLRFLAASPEEVRSLSAYFLRVMEKYKGEQALKMPHYVVISTSKTLSDRCAFLAELLKEESLKCFSYLAVYDELKNLPKECSVVLQIQGTQGMMFHYGDSDEGLINFVPDIVTGKDASDAVMEAAEYKLDLQGGKYALPEMLTFLEMYHVGKYEHLNVRSRWKESNPVASLRAPVGVNSDGGLFYLDLHEYAHGPHGLVAGMTGSGKSEFIITYILSMAANYSPEDVAFILIDYKGGGLVGAFKNDEYCLPHLAGTITNLDGAAITRSLLSIQSELKRRQAVFNEARRKADEGTMDIYKYQKLYRNGIVSEPMPHLLIISDEFAELKSQQPEFMEQLISTARIGRSLGVHLILATQKPSGVVSDQIWANSRFRVSLKVQDRADSMEMLKRPDAAELVETGRFYLQVGYNELFELGQSAWCGAPYLPEDVILAADEKVQMIDRQGNVIEEAKPEKRVEGLGEAKKQIVEIVRYLAGIAEEEHVKAKPLWLPEIPARITVAELEEKYKYKTGFALAPVIGELDDPCHQEQRLLTMPLFEKGNILCCGAAGSGKEELLTTVIYSLCRSYSSGEVNLYILDFGAETLQMFEDAPQTGGTAVCDEEEKIVSLFRMLEREVKDRKKRFKAAGGEYIAYRRAGGGDIPAIVVVINEYANFAEQYEALDDKLASFTRDCTKYGIYLIVSNPSQMGIRYKLQQNFSQIYVLQVNDKTDYTVLLGNTGGVYPSKISGRGIYREKEVYEFQTACVAKDPKETAQAVKGLCTALKEKDMRRAKRIPVLPRAVYAGHLEEARADFDRFPVGLDAATAEPVCMNLAKGSVGQVLAMARQDTIPFAEGIAGLSGKIPGAECYVIDPEQALVLEGLDEAHYATGEPEKMVVRLFGLTVERNNAYKKAGGRFPDNMDIHPVIVFLAGLGQIKKLLSDDGRDKLRRMMDKTSGSFQLFFWVFDDYQSSNFYCTESWCGGDGIWVGNGIGDQMRLGAGRGRQLPAKKLDYTTGYLVRGKKLQPVKLLISERLGVETEEEDGEE